MHRLSVVLLSLAAASLPGVAHADGCAGARASFNFNPTMSTARGFITCLETGTEGGAYDGWAASGCPQPGIGTPVVGGPKPGNPRGHEAVQALKAFKAENNFSDAAWVSLIGSTFDSGVSDNMGIVVNIEALGADYIRELDVIPLGNYGNQIDKTLRQLWLENDEYQQIFPAHSGAPVR